MKIFVKTLKGKHFQIEVKPQDTVGDVKKIIESVQGENAYPSSRQVLIYQGKELTDGSTLKENKVTENCFIVVMLLKSKSSSGATSVATVTTPALEGLATPESSSVEASISPPTTVTNASPPASTPAPMPTPDSRSVEASTTVPATVTNASPPAATCKPLPTSASPVKPSITPPTITPPTIVTNATLPASNPSMPTSVPASIISSSVSKSDADGRAASNVGAGKVLEETIIQHILDMGGGTWDRDTVIRALRAASNNPERAVEYLYSGFPKHADVLSLPQSIGAGKPTNISSVSQQPTLPASVPSRRTNAGPLNIFPPGFTSLGSGGAPSSVLDFLRNSEQFQALRAMVQANPQVLQPMLQEFEKQNPYLMRLIQEHQTDFHRLLNEPIEDEGNILDRFADTMPHAIQVTPVEHAAIERLEAMGFDRSTVLEVYFACNKNEKLTANYLIDHLDEFED